MAVDELTIARMRCRFYEAALMPELWPDVLREMEAATGTAGIGIIAVAASGAHVPVASSGAIAASFQTFVEEDWTSRNSRGRRALTLLRQSPQTIHKLHTDEDMFTADEMRRDPLYQDHFPRFQIGPMAGAMIASVDGRHLCIEFMKPRGRETFSPEEREGTDRLLDGVRAAGLLALRASAMRGNDVLTLLEAIGRPALLVRQDGQVVQANAGTRAVLGDALVVRSGRLVGRRLEVQAALQRAIRSAAWGSDPAGSILVPREERLPLIVSVSPVVGLLHDVFRQADALVIVTDTEEAPAVDEAAVRAAFSLSGAEMRLASTLMAGASIQDAARRLGVSVATARVQLKSVFRKTGTNRQGEMISLLSRFRR